ncbi:hypothetical protein Tco_0719564 [Tanacetum coccineum]
MSLNNDLRSLNRLHKLEVSDDMAEVVMVMFDETARSLVKCSAESILETEYQQTSWAPDILWSSKPTPIMSMPHLKALLARRLFQAKG